MSTLFKDLYSESFYQQLSEGLATVVDDFDKERFMLLIYCDEFERYELKQRVRHTAEVMQQFLPDDFSQGIKVVLKLVQYFEASISKSDGLAFLFLPEYIERYGLDHFDSSVAACEIVTQFISCEFAVRPFIIRYPDKMLKQMQLWSTHSSNKVRRLASEGSRPRLPWGMALPRYKKDPLPLMPILTQLMDDECEIVRRSVANNLNDIAKDNPDVVIQFAKQHLGSNANRDRLIKHACRTLLKNGEQNTLMLFGYDSREFEVSSLVIKQSTITVGSALEFSFSVKNNSKNEMKLRLEYGIYFKKSNGSLSRKVFKISERVIAAHEVYSITRKQSFKVVTTRKLYLGQHQVSVIINGKEFDKIDFDLRD